MCWTWGQEFCQQGNYRKLRNCERQNTRAEGCYGVLDHILLLFECQGVEVSPTARFCRSAGDAEIDYATDLGRRQ